MNELAKQYFKSNGEFEGVHLLDGSHSYAEVCSLHPAFPRGWYELGCLSKEDRIEFTRDFWLERLPFDPRFQETVEDFFSRLEDVCPILRKKGGGNWVAEMVYSLRDNSTFFRGFPPAAEMDWDGNYPREHGSFLRVHNGFGKLSEMGLIVYDDLEEKRRELIEKMLEHDVVRVTPGTLYPFYETFDGVECFYQAGTAFLSWIDGGVDEERAFPNFLAWLADFLEGEVG
jgi:hypothetical protein